MSWSSEVLGGDEGNRTPDLMNAIHALSQLSYVPNALRFIAEDGGVLTAAGGACQACVRASRASEIHAPG